MHALVTGGGGFLGRYVVEQLRARGDAVRVFSRGRYPELDALGVDVVQGDVRDAKAVAAACAGIDVVFHVAAVPGVWGPWSLFHGINVVGTQHVIDGCLQHGVKKLVFTSSPSVVFDGRPHENADERLPYPEKYLCCYPHTKALAERAVLAANGTDGLATCALRPHLVWGPRDNHLVPRVIRKGRQRRLTRVGDGTNLVSLTYVENAAHAHLAAADALALGSKVAGQAYFVNEPEPVNLWAWIDALLMRAGLRKVERSLSLAAATKLGAVCETVYALLRLKREPPLTRFVALQLGSSHWYDVGKAQRDFGYAPLVSVDEGLRRLEPELRRLASGR